jgi:hypothetical protein
MREIQLDKLTGLVEPLMRFFYAMLVVSLLAVLFGSPGSALFFLVVGALAQVLRASIQELQWQRQSDTAPARKRPAPRSAASRPVAQRPTARPANAAPQTSRRRAALSR